MNVLLTFTGFRDPYALGLLGQEEQAGPILSLVSSRPFDKIILFSTPNTEKNTADTQEVLQRLFPSLKIQIKDLSLNDPTDYVAILRGLRTQIRKIIDDIPDASFYISVASGTPQMHACWVLLAASGEIPAQILHVRPPQFITTARPLVSEVDLTSPDFPRVRADIAYSEKTETPTLDLNNALQLFGIVGDHPKMKKVLDMMAALAPSNAPLLILGETGTGKEVFARLAHLLSDRREKNFIPINCAAIPQDLVESILFGHKKGAFTGATSDQIGKFEVAAGGTLFLDELGELPVPIQAKLLRVLQDGLVEPLGEKKPHQVNVRIIAATNQDVGKMIRAGRFRQDLYYRLNVGEIHLPPLRERRSDIPKLALHILDRLNAGFKNPKRLAPSALTRLQSHSWPGNVRELENVIERSLRLAASSLLEADDLLISEPVTYADPLAALPEPHENFSLETYLTSARKQLMLRALEAAGGNQSKAAKLLGNAYRIDCGRLVCDVYLNSKNLADYFPP